jgi:hypothetical protein
VSHFKRLQSHDHVKLRIDGKYYGEDVG